VAVRRDGVRCVVDRWMEPRLLAGVAAAAPPTTGLDPTGLDPTGVDRTGLEPDGMLVVIAQPSTIVTARLAASTAVCGGNVEERPPAATAEPLPASDRGRSSSLACW
jgi:hypothetical protein